MRVGDIVVDRTRRYGRVIQLDPDGSVVVHQNPCRRVRYPDTSYILPVDPDTATLLAPALVQTKEMR